MAESTMAMSFLSTILMLFLESFVLPPQPVGEPVPPAQILRYVPANANVALHLDFQSIYTQLNNSANALKKQTFIAENPQLKEVYRKLEQQVRRMQRQLNRQIPIALGDIHHITFAMIFNPRSPELIFTLRGKFTPALPDQFVKAVRMETKKETLNGYQLYLNQEKDKPSLAYTPDGHILIASTELLKNIIQAPPKPAENNIHARIMQQHTKEQMLFAALHLSGDIRQIILQNVGPFRSLFQHTESLYASIQYNASKLNIYASNQNTLKRYQSILTAFGQWSVAGELWRNSMLHLADGLIDESAEYPNEILTAIANHKQAILAYLRQQLGQNPQKYQVTMHKDFVTLALHGSSGMLVPMAVMLVVYLSYELPRPSRRYQSPRRPMRPHTRSRSSDYPPPRMPVAPPPESPTPPSDK